MTTPTKAASILLILGFAAVAGFSTIPEARAQGPVCNSHQSVVSQLEGKYAEAPASMGLASNGAIVEVFTSDKGTWTITITTPNGMTCLIAAGEHWEAVEKKKAKFTPSRADSF